MDRMEEVIDLTRDSDNDSQEESCSIELLLEKCGKRQGEFELEHSKRKKIAKERMNKICTMITCGTTTLPAFSYEVLLKPVEAFDILLNLTSDDDKVCFSKPVGVMRAATFVVANGAVGKVDDLKADDLGVWDHKGKPIRKYKVARLPSGEVYGAELTKDSGDDIYQLVRVYYHHKHTPSFRRTLFYVTGLHNIPLTIIQYTFSDGVPIPIKMAPHGNSVNNQRPFCRTQTSTLEFMKANLPDTAPKEVISKTYEKAGGMLNMASCSEVGRDLRQVYNMKSSLGSISGLTSNCDKDLIYDLLDQHYHSASEFVRSVNFAEGIMSLVGTNQQFSDLSRFCACNRSIRGSVLGIDPTFNLGDFFVTPSVYEHRLIKNKVTGKHPYFIGPVLIHVDRKYGTYYYFASQLKKLCPDLENLTAIGTDGEEALSSAFLTVFPNSIHLLCSLHKRGNIMRKLREYKVGERIVKEILADIFGNKVEGDVNFEGLIDADGSSEFMKKLETLRLKWESQCKGFHECFSLHETELICSSLLKSVRSLAGLGNPPQCYTTNGNESLNNLLKRKVNFKRHEWPQFHEILYSVIKEQETEFVKAIFSQGEYEIIMEYKHLQVTHLNWIQMNSGQRQARIEKAQKAKLHDKLRDLSASEASSSVQISKQLSIDVEDARISHVSQERVENMWKKAEELLSIDGLVLPSAGATNTARQVASLSAFKSGKTETPHNVTSQQRKVGTEVKCDCPVYRSSPNLCQHALAAAEHMNVLPDYIRWIRKTKKTLNLSQLVADHIPSNAGQKPTSRRKGAPKRKKQQPVDDTENSSPLIATASTCLSPEVVPNRSSAYRPSPDYTSVYYTPPYSRVGNYSTFSPMPSYYMPPPDSSYLMRTGYGMPGMSTSSYPSFSSFQIMSPMYAHSIDMQSSYNVAPVNQSADMSQGAADMSQGNPVFTLQWLTGKIRKCYGCASNIRADTSALPKPPYDLVVRYRERRYYRDTDTQMLKLTKNEENTYYHPMQRCIRMKHPSFDPSLLDIPGDLACALLPVHKSHLFDNFGIRV